jgi:predicted amidohydrolase
VLSPDGTVQAVRDTGDGIVYGDVSLAAARAKSFSGAGPPDKLAARRPALYENLTLNSYLWDPMELHGLYGHRPLPAGRRSRVAVVQLTPEPGRPAANMGQIEAALASLRERDAGQPADIAVFPEYTLTGRPGDGRESVALPAADVHAWHEQLVALAQREALHLMVGYAEQRGERMYSVIVLAGPGGVMACYDKTHVVGEERSWCSPGAAGPPVIDLPLGRVGLLIDSDLCFPELARSLAIEGCDLLLVAGGAGLPPVQAAPPTAVPLPPPAITAADPYHFHLARQRAIENECYVALASPPAPQGTGCSAVFGPGRDDESVLAAGETGVTARFIDTTHTDTPYPRLAVVRSKPLLGMRQPHLYDALQIDRAAQS